ncbi:MAG TPA: PKD domain-containing protein [Candidatus Saccharibacteria bacterium]|nr:PKD domain-containing protein [Candidatus Saccharibacteria bacterium]
MRNLAMRLAPKKVLSLAGLLLFALTAIGTATFVPKVYAGECDNNAVFYCGFTSRSEFISSVRNNQDGLGHRDLQSLYGYFGLGSDSYDRFASTARDGTVYRDGRVVVDGQTVMTNAQTLGRQNFNSTPINIGGGTYYLGVPANRWSPGVSSFGVKVLFDGNGTPQFVVMPVCGNPVTGDKVSSGATCKGLVMSDVAGKPLQKTFTTNASAMGLASVTKVVYDFGDGTTQEAANPLTPITHTYAKPGEYTAKVTVYASAPGGTTITATSAACTKKVSIPVPVASCVALTGAILNKDEMSYSFTATAKFGDGVVFESADFDFGDGKTATGVKPSGTTVTTTHKYDKESNYTAIAVLKFSIYGAPKTAEACRAIVQPKLPPVSECKPGIPVGDSRCTPCPYDATLPANDPRCSAPPTPTTVLPNTGAGNIVAVGAVALVGGFLLYRHLLFRKHKAAFLAADNDTSPLPLAQPLESSKPLAGTPLAAKAKSRRLGLRRRQF